VKGKCIKKGGDLRGSEELSQKISSSNAQWRFRRMGATKCGNSGTPFPLSPVPIIFDG
jgi:hypothetical protein